MRQLLTGLVVLALAVPVVRAEVKTSKESAGLAALMKEFQEAQAAFQKQLPEAIKAAQGATTAEEKQAAQKKLVELLRNNPAPKYAARFLEFAEKNAKDPSAVDALGLVLQLGAAGGKDSPHARALAVLQKDYVKSPHIRKVLQLLANAGDAGSRKLLDDVIAGNPNRKVQARAYEALIAAAEAAIKNGEQLKNEAVRERVEKQRGKAFVEQLLARAEKAGKEIDGLKKVLQEKYADLAVDLTIGKPAPEVESEDLSGKKVKLSDLRGKVVVLDVWATWCGPCRAMIPHEREMVERLKDKPFVLVSVSIDKTKEPLMAFLAKEKMPWTHWWSGVEEGIVPDWKIQSIPSIYIIDAKGVLRDKGKRGEELEKVVNELLKEMEKKGDK
jgi:thiol-disulfide isomerase/thioredoxin